MIPGVPHHITQRGNRQQPIFFSEEDYRAYIEILALALTRHGTRCLAWCLMPNYWHLVLWPRVDGDLGRFARRLTQRHAQAWHGQARHPRPGPSLSGPLQGSWSRMARIW